MTTIDGLRYIDSDGHILEHPTAMPDYAPAEYRDRVWHIETDKDGVEWLHYNGTVTPSNFMSLAGTAGFPDEKVEQVRNGEIRYSEVRPAAYTAKARLQDMDTDGIDLAVLYPTSMLGLQSVPDEEFARVQARAYNDWASDHTQEGEGRLFAAGAVPPMNDEDGVEAVADEIRRVAEKPGMVSVFLRPNPSVDWRPFNDKVYDPVWQAAADTGLVLAFHPFLDARPSRRVPGPEDWRGRSRTGATRRRRRSPPERLAVEQHPLHPGDRQPGRRDALDLLHHRRGRVRALPGHQVPVPRGQRRLAGALAGAPRPPLEEVRVGRAVARRCCRRSTSGASAGSASIPTSRCWRSPPTRRCAAPTGSSGRRTTRTPTPSSPASPRSSPRHSSRCRCDQQQVITSESALALYGIG